MDDIEQDDSSHSSLTRSVRAQLLMTLCAVLVATGFFVSKGPPPAIHIKLAARSGDIDQLQRCLSWGADPDDLLEKGADPSSRNAYGEGPLAYAIHASNVGIAALLLERGADPNAQDQDGTTPLELALHKETTDIADLLRRHVARE